MEDNDGGFVIHGLCTSSKIFQGTCTAHPCINLQVSAYTCLWDHLASWTIAVSWSLVFCHLLLFSSYPNFDSDVTFIKNTFLNPQKGSQECRFTVVFMRSQFIKLASIFTVTVKQKMSEVGFELKTPTWQSRPILMYLSHF